MSPVYSPHDSDPDDEGLAQALRASRALEEAPEALVQRAIALFEARPRPAAATPALSRLKALLRFDSALAPPLAFGRRSATAEQRQLLYTVEACDVDLRVTPAEGDDARFVVSGQLLGPDCQGVVFAQVIDADPAGADPASAALNEFGEFRLPPLAAGHWQLTLELADRAVELPPLLLTPGAAAR
jgi:hypothetical protein